MLNLNRVEITGNLTDNPRVLYKTNGLAFTVLRIASTDRNKVTTFIDVETYETQAKTAIDYLSKGRRIFVEGELKQRTYLNRDNVKVTTYFIQSSNWQFMDKPKTESRDCSCGRCSNKPESLVETGGSLVKEGGEPLRWSDVTEIVDKVIDESETPEGLKEIK